MMSDDNYLSTGSRSATIVNEYLFQYIDAASFETFLYYTLQRVHAFVHKTACGPSESFEVKLLAPDYIFVD